ncbi:MAG: quinohemoprotein ethanol dehydrogenase [Saprospiraceae bacterium]|jgi:quinohemoprotein ethanol dehydrogenase
MKNLLHSVLFGISALILLDSCSEEVHYEKGTLEHIQQVTESITDQVLINADDKRTDWLTYGGDYREQRYADLDQINKENVDELGLAWSADLGTKRGLQATPLVVDGILYFSGPFNKVWAYDARTGAELWVFEHDYNTDSNIKLCCGFSNRGLAMYKGDLFMGTLDGKLLSIDASTGTKNWEVVTISPDLQGSVTGAPRIVKGNVVIGNGGADIGARGYVSAYDAASGELEWRFFTVPGDPSMPYEHADLEEAAKTWTGDQYWKQGGGGTAWDAIVYDPELNLVYIGVGNGAHWDREWRSPDGGDNLYLSSIVALNADDGSYVWHFQTTPGESWDYTATQPLILADMDIDGTMRKVIMQAPKNGFFYVIDRTNGDFISANNFVYQNWAKGIDENGRPIEAEGARYLDGKTHWISPSSHGGHNWPPMSHNPKTGLVYIPTAKQADGYARTSSPTDPGTLGGGIDGNVSLSNKLYAENVFDPNPEAPIPGTSSGRLIAWDPIAQKEVWGVDQPSLYNGGLISTSTGLLMQGDAEGMFTIRDVTDGSILKQFDLRSGIVAPPITYLVDGEQYVTILVGWGGYMAKLYKHVPRVHPGTVYTFKLGGAAEMPEKMPAFEYPLTTLRDKATPERIGEGWNVFTQYCIMCHPSPGAGHTSTPDLARSPDGIFGSYDRILLEGTLASEGMPNFNGRITAQEIADVKSFIFYSSKVLGEGMNPTDYLTSIAQMQYLADSKAKLRD